LVAQGSVEAVLEHEACYAWDLAAMEVIVGEAGGRLSTLAGDPPRAGADLVVSNGAVHDELLGLVATAS
jgi:histidinol-phosphatase